MTEKKTANELIAFINKAVSPYHAVEAGAAMLSKEGYSELKMDENWTINDGGKYYIKVYGTTLFAFFMGANQLTNQQFRIAAAHTDFPCLHVKPTAELKPNGYLRVNTEIYGGPILNTWMDRPLSIAGRAALRSEKVFEPQMRIVDLEKPILTIPNMAIHMNRDVNKGIELTKQTDMLPLLGLMNEKLNSDHYFIDFLAKQLNVKSEDILDFDLYIYNAEQGILSGMEEEFISSPRLDNMTSCFALINGLINGKRMEGINFIALYDNEEIGSVTKQGADSALLTMVLEKICHAIGLDKPALDEAIFRSFLLSVDVAHANHPNHPEKYDPVNNANMNDGIVFKISSNQKYTFDTEAVAILQQLCEKYNIPYKKFVNHADVPGGGTLGPIISSWLPMKTVDIGIPILAMHSARELMGAKDQLHLEKLITAFFTEESGTTEPKHLEEETLLLDKRNLILTENQQLNATQIETQTEGRTESQTEGKMELQTEGKMELQTEEKMELQTEGKTELQTEEKTELQTEGKTELQTEGKMELQTEGKMELQTEERMGLQMDTQIESQIVMQAVVNEPEWHSKYHWYDSAVFYHIYPFGLCGVSKHNDGGDIQHNFDKISEWIPHMKQLGITGLYIGPLFESSGHGYETIDYKLVDRRLGDNADFAKFVADCHQSGIKVVVDGVFNHSGRDFFAFRDLREKRERSEYRDWYCNVNFQNNNDFNDGFSYEAWRGYNIMPRYNMQNPAVRNYLLEVVRFWKEQYDIDGIRLDCADVLDFQFMKELRSLCNNLKPDFWLMGEVIHGDYSRWVNDQMLHSVTNYELHKGLYSGHNDNNYFEIAHTAKRLFDSNGGISKNGRLYNFAENHDVDRLINKLKFKEHIPLVYLLEYMLPGIPSIYYGGEFGIAGKHENNSDDGLRPALNLGDFYLNDKNLKDAEIKANEQFGQFDLLCPQYQELASLLSAFAKAKYELEPLTGGEYKELLLTNRQYVFARILNQSAVLVAVNNDEKDASVTIRLPFVAAVTEQFTGKEVPVQNGSIQITIEANSGKIFTL